MTFFLAQSGQSLIEHSYKADSDLSPAGWDYAARLKEFVLERRAKSLQQRGIDPTTRKLVVCLYLLSMYVVLSSIADLDLSSTSITSFCVAFPDHQSE